MLRRQPAPENYMDRFEWSKRDVVSYVRDLVELFGGVDAFAKGLMCHRRSVEQVLRGDAPPEYVIFQLGICFNSESGKYYKLVPQEIYQLADGVMPLHPAEWLELTTLRIEVERLKERAAQSSDVSLADEAERQRRKISSQAQEIDRLRREVATLKRERLAEQGVVMSPANDDPDRERLTLIRRFVDTFQTRKQFCDAYNLSRGYVQNVLSGITRAGPRFDAVARDAIVAGKEAPRLNAVKLCQEEIRAFDSYAEFAAKYHLSTLSVLNMMHDRIARPRSKWAPVIEAAIRRREREKRDAA